MSLVVRVEDHEWDFHLPVSERERWLVHTCTHTLACRYISHMHTLVCGMQVRSPTLVDSVYIAIGPHFAEPVEAVASVGNENEHHHQRDQRH